MLWVLIRSASVVTVIMRPDERCSDAVYIQERSISKYLGLMPTI